MYATTNRNDLEPGQHILLTTRSKDHNKHRMGNEATVKGSLMQAAKLLFAAGWPAGALITIPPPPSCHPAW